MTVVSENDGNRNWTPSHRKHNDEIGQRTGENKAKTNREKGEHKRVNNGPRQKERKKAGALMFQALFIVDGMDKGWSLLARCQ